MFRLLFSIASMLLPWPLRRLILVRFLGYSIDKSARIGYSLICPVHLVLGPEARIGHLTVCNLGIEKVQLGQSAYIGNLNWITGTAVRGTPHFKDQSDRRPELHVDDHAAITNRHYIDCTATVSIGRFATFAGCRSVILTHSIDLTNCEQGAQPVSIGAYCFVGAMCVLLPGATLPDNSVLGANSLLNKPYSEAYLLYAGSPARPIKAISKSAKYFTRSKGFID